MGSIDFKPKVESALRLIRESEDLSGRDKELLQEFKRDLKIDGSSDAWVHKLLTHVRMMAERLGGADLEGAGKEDLKGVVEWVQGREDIAKATKRDYREALKRFYKWLNGGEHPERSCWINTTRKRRNRKLPEDLLSEDDVKELLGAAKNTRDRALIAVLWETGARIGELIDLKVGSFKERRHGKKILIKGKTGPRRLPLITSMPHVNDWLSNHPRRDDPEAPLWCKIKQRGMGERLTYQYVRKLLRETAERAGIGKPVNPHNFRHSRATYMASRMTEAEMCEYFGWVQGSDRPADYVHLSGRDIDLKYDRLHGFEEEESTEKSEFSPAKCPRCDQLNEPEARFCQKCGLALDEKASKTVERRERLGEYVQEKAEKIEITGSLDDLLLTAAKKGLKDILKDEDLEERLKEERG